jgi:hypothetical protein
MLRIKFDERASRKVEREGEPNARCRLRIEREAVPEGRRK